MILAVACEAIPATEFTDRPVVCCYLTADETPTLTVQKLIPFQSDAVFSDEDVNKLDITISDLTTDSDYKLTNTGEGTYGNENLTIESGHEYKLYFVYDNVPVTAQTTVPSKPQEVSFSSTTIEAMSFGGMPPAMTKAPDEGIEITWKNDEGDYYIVEGKTTSTNTIRDIDEDDEQPAKSFKHSYTQGTTASLSSSDFNYYGKYSIYVLHVCEEYAILSQGGATTSTTLVDARGNVDGGYGIFTGISGVVRTISVTQRQGF